MVWTVTRFVDTTYFTIDIPVCWGSFDVWFLIFHKYEFMMCLRPAEKLEKSNWIFSLQKFISKLIFAGYTGSKNSVRNRLKIQFVEIDFSEIKYRSTGGKKEYYLPQIEAILFKSVFRLPNLVFISLPSAHEQLGFGLCLIFIFSQFSQISSHWSRLHWRNWSWATKNFNSWIIEFTVIQKRAIWHLAILLFWSILSLKNWSFVECSAFGSVIYVSVSILRENLTPKFKP